MFCRHASTAIAIVCVGLVCSQTFAQDSPPPEPGTAAKPKLTTIPLDQNDDRVRALRGKRASSRSFSKTTERSVQSGASRQDKRFLAAIDLSKIDFTPLRRLVDLPNDPAREFETHLLDRTIYGDKEDEPTWFKTHYQWLGATLHCHWAYDARLSAMVAAQQAKMEEAARERAHRSLQRSAPAGAPRAAVEPPVAKSPVDAHPIERERQFKVAGRPCVLRVLCERLDDPRCEEAFVDRLAGNVIIVRTGD